MALSVLDKDELPQNLAVQITATIIDTCRVILDTRKALQQQWEQRSEALMRQIA